MSNDTTTVREIRPVTTAIGDALKFARLLARGWKAPKAKVKAGFSHNYPTRELMSAIRTRQAIQTVSRAREELQATLGLTITDCAEFAQEVRDDPDTSKLTALKANAQIIEVNGYKAPQVVHIQQHTMIADLARMSQAQLTVLLGEVGK